MDLTLDENDEAVAPKKTDDQLRETHLAKLYEALTQTVKAS